MKTRADSFLAEVDKAGRGRRILLKDLWGAFRRISPHLVGSVDARVELAELLAELAKSGALKLPRQKSGYDAVQLPPLPKWILLPAPTPTVRALERAAQVGWHPALAFVSKLEKLGDDELEELLAIQAFLRDDADPVVTTVRERSLELFADEKRLEDLARGRLFGAGRLDFALLRCVEVRTPCVYRDIGVGAAALIVENKDTFHSACEAVRRLGPESPVRWVIFGSGKAISTTLDSVNDWPTRPKRAWYFGDLDAAGLEIAVLVARIAETWARPMPIACPAALYRSLVERALRRGVSASGTAVSSQRAAELAGWLPHDIRPTVVDLLVRGGRWPQEAVTGPILEMGLRSLAIEVPADHPTS